MNFLRCLTKDKRNVDSNERIVKTLYKNDHLLQDIGKAKRLNLSRRRDLAIPIAIDLVRRIRKRGIELKFIPEEKLIKLTGNSMNYATVQNNTIYLSDRLRNPIHAGELVAELGHEYGAWRLIQIYGDKQAIPKIYDPKKEEMRATHYLDLLCWEE